MFRPGKHKDLSLDEMLLKELEANGLIIRTAYNQIPPKVEYTLSQKGQSLMKVLDQLCTWGMENRPASKSLNDAANETID